MSKPSKTLAKKGVREISITDLEVLAANQEPALSADKFAAVNHYHHLARTSMAQSCAYMILAGVELLALRQLAEHGTWETNFAGKRSGKSRNDSTFAFSYDTAQNYMRLADAAKKHVKELRLMLGDGSTPLSEMSAEQQEKVVAVVRKSADGSTYKDLAQEWGIAKKPLGHGAGGGNGGGSAPTLSPEQAALQSAQDLFHQLELQLFQGCSEGDKQKLLALPITSDKPGKVTGLSELRDHLTKFLALVEAALEEKKKAVRKK